MGEAKDILILFGLGYLLYKTRKVAESYTAWREDIGKGWYESQWLRTYIYKMPHIPVSTEEPLI